MDLTKNKAELFSYLSEPSKPWLRGYYIGGAGLFAAGWTLDNKIFMLFPDYYVITDPFSGKHELMIEEDNLLKYLSNDNLEFEIKKLDQRIKVFGLRGGNGNHFTSDFWSLDSFHPELGQQIVGLTNTKKRTNEMEYWKSFELIKLQRLEYSSLTFGFSPNEKHFGIFGSSGAEIFSRE